MFNPDVMCAAILAAAASAWAQPPAGPVKIGAVVYEKQATREATERHVMDLLRPGKPRWGPFYIMASFPYDAKKGPRLAEPTGVEAELPKMKPGGAGPDLALQYDGKGGRKIEWRGIGNAAGREIKLDIYGDTALDEDAIGYVYAPVVVEKATTVEVTMGSDDGLRFWCNGKLLVDAEVVRGLDPESHKIKLDLQPGANHILAKISQVKGGYQFQINVDTPLDPFTAAQLEYQLNLDFPMSDEDQYYRAVTIAAPADVVLEVGGMDLMPPDARGERRPIVCTRRGDVFIVENAYEEPAFNAKFKRFATGLHEALGLAVRTEPGPDGKDRTVVYTVQRGEMTRLIDETGDDVADLYETFCADWGISGNYHEFAFGPKFDRAGNAWATLNVGFCGGLGKSVVRYRGMALKIDGQGRSSSVCDGMRSPNGIGEFTDGAMFYLDNQGDYVGTNRMSLMSQGGYHGHPSSLHWREGNRPGGPTPPRVPATIWFPYKKMGQSAADFLLYGENGQNAPIKEALAQGKFGPFQGQVFVGDQTLCTVQRVCIEQVDGQYQGACFPFRGGLDSGVNRLCWAGDGSMFVGMTDRGWGSTGRMRYGLQRLVWTGKVPFEVETMRIEPDGFELKFTQDLDPKAAADTAAYGLVSYTYEYHAEYGSAEMDTARQRVVSAEVVGARTVRLHVDKLRTGEMGYVHELALPGVRSMAGNSVLHPVAYYTVQRIPQKPPRVSGRGD